jgi:hypothetical protein
MARYTLAADEKSVLETWLFEPSGYLDQAFRADGQTARQALAATPALDITNWIRTNTRHPNCLLSDWVECGMVWWLLKNDGVNVNANQVPAEASTWRPILQQWVDSIDAAFQRVPQAQRDQATTVTLYSSSGAQVGTVGSGTHLARQSSGVGKVRTVTG